MNTSRYLLALGACLILSVGASAGDNVGLRLVSARAGGKKSVDPALADVEALLGRLPFTRYKVLSQATGALPSDAPVELDAGISVGLTGDADALQISLTKDGKQVFATTVALRQGKPFVTVLPTRAPDGGKLLLVAILK